MMPSSFHPTGDGDYLLFGDDHAQNLQEIRRHSPRDADAYERYHHDLDRVCQAVRPLFDNPPPEHLRQRPRGRGRREVAARPPRRRRPQDDARRRPAAHRQRRGLARRLLRARGDQGLPRVVLDHRLQGRPDVAGLRAGAALPQDGRARRRTSARGRSTRAATAASPRCWPAPRRRTAPRSGSARRSTSVLTEDGRAVGVVLEDGTEFRAPVVVSALDPRRTFLELVEPRELPLDLVDNVRRMKFRGVSAKVNFALDGLPVFPALPDTVDHYGGFLNIGPTIEYVERAFDAAKYGWYSERPFIDAAIQSVVDPDMAPPGKHVMSCFVQYAPYELKGSDWDTERETLRRQGAGRPRVALPGLRRPGAAPRGRHARRHRGPHRPDRGQHLRRRVPRPADVLLPARRRAGASTPPRSTATTSAARAPTPAAA